MTSTIDATTTASTPVEIIQRAIGHRVPASHQGLIAEAADAIQERDYELFDSLLRAGQRLGARHEQVVNVLQEAGLRQRPQAEPVSSEETPSGMSRLIARLDSLTAFARRHGYTGS